MVTYIVNDIKIYIKAKGKKNIFRFSQYLHTIFNLSNLKIKAYYYICGINVHTTGAIYLVL